MMRTLAIAVATAIGLLATQATAQDYPDNNSGMQTGTRFLREPENATAAEARWMQKRVVNCVWNRNEDEVRDLLANSDFYQIDWDAIDMTPDSAFDDLEVTYCIGRLMRGAANNVYQTYMRIPFSTLRNALAEEAYLGDFDGPPMIAPNHVVDIYARFNGERVHPQVSTMAAMADCIVYNALETSHALMRARPGSDGEGEVIEQLGPVVAACANSSEDELSVQNGLVRQLVADGLWSRSHYGSNTALEAE
ncbi:hypothetical protein [Aurantiacibacter sp. D1-12]|uniref:hypothetical protein n=1 Tax=Aurantiacibacter sp. D1-12 TaxID=2993658 RepID=UPI00237D0DC5|nr:hypothetical protein [Aurantiacibacter sp. D1-12]MDE1466620.1 hypothetical protein [Aurantiacibacter sp. D1-12]